MRDFAFLVNKKLGFIPPGKRVVSNLFLRQFIGVVTYLEHDGFFLNAKLRLPDYASFLIFVFIYHAVTSKFLQAGLSIQFQSTNVARPDERQNLMVYQDLRSSGSG